MHKLSILNISLLTLAFLSSSYAQEQKIAKLNQTKTFNKNQRIVDGTEVSESDDTWRFIVALKYPSGFQFCAGNLITPEWVLTAAHCTLDIDTTTLVGVGNYNKIQTTNYHVAEIIVNENYNPVTMNNDIALIHLTQPVNEPNVTPIAYDISSSPTPSGTESSIAGWGNLSTNGSSPDILREVLVPIIDKDTCNAIDSYNGTLTDNMLCAGYMSGGRNSCFGDSGGPLIVDNTLIGIISFGAQECAQMNFPTIYTNVKKYANWISSHIEDSHLSDPTTYETGHPYENNTDETQELSIPDADELVINISGEIEFNYDKIFITDSTGHTTEYTGRINDEYIVSGDHITVRFTSDGSVVKEGAVVSIRPATPPPSNAIYETGAYTNNTDETKELSLPGGLSELMVSITGEVEQDYDKIFITDSLGNTTEYTGALNEEIVVPGDHITVRFVSDGSVVKDGATVRIFEILPPPTPTPSIYETDHPYANNTDETQELSISGASDLTVMITGEVEQNYDKIFITDSTGNETVYTGILNEDFIVPGDHISVRFTSDGSIVKEGAVVQIYENLPSH